jgi:hypothetical protein
MSDNQGAVCNRDRRLENLAAELTVAAYPLALRRGIRGSWIKLELSLWRALAETVEKWNRLRPSVRPSDEFQVWQEGLLVDLIESAFCVALKHGIKGSLLEVELGLGRAFRLVITRRCGAN